MARRDGQPTDYAEVTAVIGMAAALKLSMRFRSLTLFILKSYPDSSDVVAAIGREAADTLSDHFSNTRVYVPGKPGLHAAVRHLAARGELTQFEIADNLKISERQVRRLLAPVQDDRQLPLF